MVGPVGEEVERCRSKGAGAAGDGGGESRGRNDTFVSDTGVQHCVGWYAAAIGPIEAGLQLRRQGAEQIVTLGDRRIQFACANPVGAIVASAAGRARCGEGKALCSCIEGVDVMGDQCGDILGDAAGAVEAAARTVLSGQRRAWGDQHSDGTAVVGIRIGQRLALAVDDAQYATTVPVERWRFRIVLVCSGDDVPQAFAITGAQWG